MTRMAVRAGAAAAIMLTAIACAGSGLSPQAIHACKTAMSAQWTAEWQRSGTLLPPVPVVSGPRLVSACRGLPLYDRKVVAGHLLQGAGF